MSERKEKPKVKVSPEKSEKVEKVEKSKSSVSKVVALRNRFFFMMYRFSSIVFITSLLCFLFSILFLVFFARQPVPPQYIPINEDGSFIKLEPLSTCSSDNDVQNFVLGAVKKLYKYDYINYADQLQEAAYYFTAPGWNEYLAEYSKSQTLAAVKENKWVVSVTPQSIPSITRRSVENGVCTWDVKTSISIIYVGNNTQNPKGDLYMRLTRNSVINNPEGLGITKSVFVESK